MLFNSYPFLLIFLPLVLSGFYLFSKFKWTEVAKGWLFLASLAFYGYWDIRFLPLLLVSILFNYFVGDGILTVQNTVQKKSILLFGIVLNLALLFYFKYVNFFLHNFSKLTHFSFPIVEVVLPLGISFFTFTQIAYLVDSYKAKARKSSLLNYALFVTIFPHLIAGPILHHKEMIGQFRSLRMFVFSSKNFAEGIFLFSLGLFKKVMIADFLAGGVIPVFDQSLLPVTLLPAWFSAICYSLQLYFDFSGYSDMAVGLGLMFNLRLPINFNSPYQADSIIDFWRRWHITLSHFLRDYLYIPLGGNRRGEVSKFINLFATMVLGGIWHGAGNTFLLWGALHGSYLVINHLYRKLSFELPNWMNKSLTLLAVLMAWVLFRSPDFGKAREIFSGLLGLNGIALPLRFEESLAFLKKFNIFFMPYWYLNYQVYHLILVCLLIPVVLKFPNSGFLLNHFNKRPKLAAIFCTFLTLLCILNFENISEFLYYQF